MVQMRQMGVHDLHGLDYIEVFTRLGRLYLKRINAPGIARRIKICLTDSAFKNLKIPIGNRIEAALGSFK